MFLAKMLLNISGKLYSSPAALKENIVKSDLRGIAVHNPDNSDALDDINEPNPHETKDGHPDDNEVTDVTDVTNDPYKSIYRTSSEL